MKKMILEKKQRKDTLIPLFDKVELFKMKLAIYACRYSRAGSTAFTFQDKRFLLSLESGRIYCKCEESGLTRYLEVSELEGTIEPVPRQMRHIGFELREMIAEDELEAAFT